MFRSRCLCVSQGMTVDYATELSAERKILLRPIVPRLPVLFPIFWDRCSALHRCRGIWVHRKCDDAVISNYIFMFSFEQWEMTYADMIWCMHITCSSFLFFLYIKRATVCRQMGRQMGGKDSNEYTGCPCKLQTGSAMKRAVKEN